LLYIAYYCVVLLCFGNRQGKIRVRENF
jgi:hypothetical protein